MNEFSKNAKFALVIAEPPENQYRESDTKRWQDFVNNIPRFAPPNKETLTIHENVWRIPLDTGMPFLCKLFGFANGAGIPLHILFLDAEPEWIKYPPDDEGKPSQATP